MRGTATKIPLKQGVDAIHRAAEVAQRGVFAVDIANDVEGARGKGLD